MLRNSKNNAEYKIHRIWTNAENLPGRTTMDSNWYVRHFGRSPPPSVRIELRTSFLRPVRTLENGYVLSMHNDTLRCPFSKTKT